MQNAFLIREGVLYQADPLFLSSLGYTPITALIEGIWNTFPEQAHLLLRERIYSNYPLTPACEGMIKVAAKRASFLSWTEFDTLREQASSQKLVRPKDFKNEFILDFKKQNYSDDEEKARLVLKAKTKSLHSLHRYESDRAVGAGLFSKKNELLALSWNTNAKNKTLHAEMNLLRSFQEKFKTQIPDQSEIWVSLKPCSMCASLLFSAALKPETLKIIFIDDDPGPFSKNSVLCEGSDLWVKAGSPKLSLIQYQPIK